MGLIRTLFERDRQHTPGVLPSSLRQLYDGDLRFPLCLVPRPYVFGNFVSTLDGIVSFKLAGYSGGGTISGSDQGDRFIMGLLRASADAIMVGSGTIHDTSPGDLWTPEYTYPEAKQLYADYRRSVLGKSEYPLVVIITSSGRLDLKRAVFRGAEARTLIVTTAAGESQLAMLGASSLPSVIVRALKDVGGIIDPKAILHLLMSQFDVRIVLHEGGPTFFGTLLAAGLVDELFLTLAPQLAGRMPNTARPGMVQGVEFLPNAAPWFQLLSVKQKAQYLYLRYRSTDLANGSA